MRKRLRKHIRTARYIVYKETLVDAKEHFWTFLGSFVGISCIGWKSLSTLTPYHRK